MSLDGFFGSHLEGHGDLREPKVQRYRARKRLAARRKRWRPLVVETLEDRRVLSAVLTAASAGAFSTLANFLDIFVDVDQILPEEAQDRLGSDQGLGNTLTYQAFQGEINEVNITQAVSDFFYLIKEGNSLVPVISVPLAFHPKLVEDLSMGFSFVVHVEVNVGQFIDIPDANSVVPNAKSMLEFLPGIGGADGILTEMTNLLGEGLSFGLGDIVQFIGDAVGFVQEAIDTAIGPIVSAIGDVAHTICKVIDAIPFVNPDCDAVQDFTEEFVSNYVGNLPILPVAPTGLLQFGADLIEALTSTFTTEGVYVSTLDGADTIDLSLLNGVDQLVYAGSESDTITGGGGDADIKLYGEDGRDTFIINNTLLFDVPRYFVDGGDGNDRLVIEGSPGNDIIRLVGSSGSLFKIIREAPNPGAGVTANEVQLITLPAGITGGTFTLALGGQTTDPPLAFDAPASDVQTALEALSSIGAGNVSVSGSPGGPYTVMFQGAKANTDVPNLATNGSGLSVAGATMTVQTLVEAGSGLGTNETQRVSLPSQASGGTFTLTFNSATTGPLAFDASATDVRNALLDLATVGAGNVDVTGLDGGPYNVEFTGALGQADQPALTADGSLLISDVSAAVTENTKGTPGTNETQRISVPAGATGGTFTLTFNGNTTGPIPFDATAAEVLDEIQQLGSIGAPGNVIVTGPNGGPWDVQFVNDFREIDQAAFTADSRDLRGGVTLNIAEADGSGTNEIQSITTNGATSGTFTLTFDNGVFARTTGPLFFDATPGEIESALAALTSVGAGNVRVTGPVRGPWLVEFIGDLAALDQKIILMDGTGLDTGFVTFSSTVVETTPGNPGGPTDEVQTITITPSGGLATGGTFTLTSPPGTSSLTTEPIAFDADGAMVDAALAAAGLVDVTVTGPAGGPYAVTFVDTLAATNIAGFFSVDTSGLSGNSAEVQAAVAGVNEVQTITPDPVLLTSGDFTLSFAGETTAPIAYNARGVDVEGALEALSTIGSNNVIVTGAAGGPWTVTFTRDLAKQNVAALIPAAGNLGGALGISVSDNFIAAATGTDEVQTFSFTPTANAGTYTVSFNGATTGPIAYNAGAGTVESALEGLATIDDVSVSGCGGGACAVTFKGGLRAKDQPPLSLNTTGLSRTGLTVDVTDNYIASAVPNEKQRIALPFGVTGGTFTLDFDGDVTGSLPFNARGSDLKAALEALPSIGVGNVNVTGPQKGPWTVEFVGALADTDVPLIVADGSGLNVDGAALTVTETTKGNDGGDNVVLQTTTVQSISSVEQLFVDLSNGQDTLIIEGDIGFPLGVFYDGGDDTDFLELYSDNAAPVFVAPVFPDDTQAVLTLDAQNVEFSNVEGGILFDAGGRAATVTVTGTDAGNEIRFAGTGSGTATFANDGQVTISLRDFGANSTVNVNGAQGDDTISIAPNGVAEFSQFTVNGNAPAGSDTVRLEGTAGIDRFTYTPGLTSTEDGHVVYDLGGGELVSVDFLGFSDIAFIGLGGTDALLVNEPIAGSNDSILQWPELGNNGTFTYTVQNFGPESAQVFPTVSYNSIETREFNTGTGSDYFGFFFENVPGVDSDVFAVGGNGVTSVGFEDQVTTFTHDISEPDVLDMEIGSGVDTYDITPGQGIEIQVRGGLDFDTLTYRLLAAAATLDITGRTISQPGLGDVVYTSLERVVLQGNLAGDTLEVTGKPEDQSLIYQPLTPAGGRFEVTSGSTEYRFEGFDGSVTAFGTPAADDKVFVLGSNLRDRIAVDAAGLTIHSTNAANLVLKSLHLQDFEALAVDGGSGDDSILVTPGLPATGEPLFIHVDGNAPNASDRLVIEDAGLGDLVLHREGPDRRSGSVTVGDLPPVDYVNVERVDILPLDPITGGTGADGLGRLVVFDTDPFEHNESLPNRTDLPALYEVAVNPNIDPGAASGVFVGGPHLPGDEDWYRFDADRTATLRFELVFEPIGPLANGNPGLPGDGQLQIEVYDPSHNLIAKYGGEGPATHTVGVEGGKTYSLRVRGATPEAINAYDIRVVSLDEIGPQVTDVFITAAPSFDLFDPKPTEGPTPLVHSITVRIQDLVERFPGFLYEALNSGIASAVGQYQVVGDHNGIIPIASIQVINDPVTVGQFATGAIILEFADPLPDDRFTLTILDNLVDPVGNRLDGEGNADQPLENPLFPSGDTVPGGNFVARFTVDSRVELGVWAAGSVYVDTNGNFGFDSENKDNDDFNEDIIYMLGYTSDNIFAGNFAANANGTTDGFDKLAAYGRVAGAFRWAIDTDNNGVPNLMIADPLNINGLPVAGNFDGNSANGDEVALKDGTNWRLDTNHDFKVDTTLAGDMVGYPIVGDFDGDGVDDLGAWTDDTFRLDLSSVLTGPAATGAYDPEINGMTDVQFTFGFPGVRERPVAADFDRDGYDDLGLWVPDRSGAVPQETAEWYILISAGAPIVTRIGENPEAIGGNVVQFMPVPFGNDLYVQFGDDYALPVVGNFDPPVAGENPSEFTWAVFTNPDDPDDVDGDGLVAPVDVLHLVNVLNRGEGGEIALLRSEANETGPYYDTNGDGSITPADALKVVNRLNASASGEGEAQGEFFPAARGVVPCLANHPDERGWTLSVIGIWNSPATELAKDRAVAVSNVIHQDNVDAVFAQPHVLSPRRLDRALVCDREHLDELLAEFVDDVGLPW